MTAEGQALQLSEVVVDRAGRVVVDQVSIDVPCGHVTALLGPNGAGKSTLVLAVGGILPTASGTIEFEGKHLTRMRPEQVRTAGVAIVPEGRRLLRDLSVRDNMRVATYALGKTEAKEGTEYALQMFPELEKLWGTIASLLSGGEQQMLVLAQALVSRPRIVLLDELSLGLAPVVVKRLMPTLEEVARSGVGILLIEQFAHVALSVSDSAYILEGGQIRYRGVSSELQQNPDLMSAAYLNAPAA
jgi:branched-chain amino acid transport system ATP-binding protein